MRFGLFGSAGIVVVVVVVVVDVDEELTGAGTAVCGMDVDGALIDGAATFATGGTVVDGVTAPTVIDCEAAAAAYTSLPDCEAETRHTPDDEKVTTPAEIEHTAEDWLEIVTVGASEASLST